MEQRSGEQLETNYTDFYCRSNGAERYVRYTPEHALSAYGYGTHSVQCMSGCITLSVDPNYVASTK